VISSIQPGELCQVLTVTSLWDRPCYPIFTPTRRLAMLEPKQLVLVIGSVTQPGDVHEVMVIVPSVGKHGWLAAVHLEKINQ
jgi:hypothetical protein